MVISEALYNIYLCKACQSFIPIWGATPSQINSLRSIQVTWQLYSVHQPMETHIVSGFALSHTPTIHYTHIIQLKSGRSMVVGHVPMVHTCSFMHTNHIDMIAHTPAFLQVGEHSSHYHHASRGWLAIFFQNFFWNFSHGEIQTRDLPLGKRAP